MWSAEMMSLGFPFLARMLLAALLALFALPLATLPAVSGRAGEQPGSQAEAAFSQGKEEYQRHRYEQASRFCEIAARAGHLDALYYRSSMHWAGEGMVADSDKGC